MVISRLKWYIIKKFVGNAGLIVLVLIVEIVFVKIKDALTN